MIYLSKKTKTIKKMQVSKAISSKKWPLGLLDAYYYNSLNTKVQKQNEAKWGNVKKKLSSQWFSWFVAILFLNKHQAFLNVH